MKLNVEEAIKNGELNTIKNEHFTAKQLKVISYILTGNHIFQTKSEIARNCDCSRVLVDNVFDLIECAYDEIIEKK